LIEEAGSGFENPPANEAQEPAFLSNKKQGNLAINQFSYKDKSFDGR
jgi:hypothetical protein